MCHLVDPWLVLLAAIYSQMITLWGWPLQLIMRGLLIWGWHWTRKDISSIHHELLDASESDCTPIIPYNYMIFFDAGSLDWLPCESLLMCASFWPLGSLFSVNNRGKPWNPWNPNPLCPSSKSPSSQAAAKAERTRGALLPKPPDKLYPRCVFGENLWETMEVKPPFFASINEPMGFIWCFHGFPVTLYLNQFH